MGTVPIIGARLATQGLSAGQRDGRRAMERNARNLLQTVNHLLGACVQAT